MVHCLHAGSKHQIRVWCSLKSAMLCTYVRMCNVHRCKRCLLVNTSEPLNKQIKCEIFKIVGNFMQCLSIVLYLKQKTTMYKITSQSGTLFSRTLGFSLKRKTPKKVIKCMNGWIDLYSSFKLWETRFPPLLGNFRKFEKKIERSS